MIDNPQTDRVTAIYDAIDAFQRQFRTGGGLHLQHAQVRASLAEHLDRALPAVPVPPTTHATDSPSRRAGLRDQIRRAVCEAEGFAWDSDMLEPDEYGEHADTVLAVLYREWPWLRAEAEDAEHAERATEVERVREEHATWRKLGRRNLERAHEENARLCANHAAALGRIREAVRRLAAHAVGFQDVLDDSDRGPWGKTIAADIAELRRVADEAQQPECGPACSEQHTYSPGCALAVGEAQQPEMCGRTRSVDGIDYPPCARSAGHEEAYCRARGGIAYFLAAPGPGRVADEAPAETPQHCAHCGATILRVTGTLAEWWVHDPGGLAACHPQQAAGSHRATPQPAAETRKDGGQA